MDDGSLLSLQKIKCNQGVFRCKLKRHKVITKQRFPGSLVHSRQVKHRGRLAAVLESPDVVGWAGGPGDTLRPAVGFFSRWARADDDVASSAGGDDSGRRTVMRRRTDLGPAGSRTVAFANEARPPDNVGYKVLNPVTKQTGSNEWDPFAVRRNGALTFGARVALTASGHQGQFQECLPCFPVAVMKHDSWTLSKFKWKKEKQPPEPPRPSNKPPDKAPQPTLVSQVDPGVDQAAVAKYKRNRYMDRKVCSFGCG
ncbi:hypothetical protein HPB48_021767 [Haemaphysalis longicornis]|uniref:Uncharacterized protein n=1 Tax=Haemaphysalis longicornis TaxID=44386 RepID=A0A9J6G2S0_HAELO|nr:hypothetical protein HPB48_021767 [Haemaphysalis longicornis]